MRCDTAQGPLLCTKSTRNPNAITNVIHGCILFYFEESLTDPRLTSRLGWLNPPTSHPHFYFLSTGATSFTRVVSPSPSSFLWDKTVIRVSTSIFSASETLKQNRMFAGMRHLDACGLGTEWGGVAHEAEEGRGFFPILRVWFVWELSWFLGKIGGRSHPALVPSNRSNNEG